MDSAIYSALSRQSGLSQELRAVANNVANMNTTGFRREAVLFAEMVEALPRTGDSISMTAARVRRTDHGAGPLRSTGGDLDLALDGAGFFMIEGKDGPLLTRAGAFRLDQSGRVVTPDGRAALDPGGAPVTLPPGASDIEIGADGTITAGGRVAGAFAVVDVEVLGDLHRRDGVAFEARGELRPAEAAVVQGFLESSNVSPVTALARMIEVQRGYELGRDLLQREDERQRAATRVLGQGA